MDVTLGIGSYVFSDAGGTPVSLHREGVVYYQNRGAWRCLGNPTIGEIGRGPGVFDDQRMTASPLGSHADSYMWWFGVDA